MFNYLNLIIAASQPSPKLRDYIPEKRRLMTMKMPYLGRIRLRWCRNCNVPALAKRCSACGSTTAQVPLTPPGDPRVASRKEIEEINRLSQDQFGNTLAKEDKILLLNRVSGLDRLDEVIIDGMVVGAVRYDVESASPKLLLRMEGAARLWSQVKGSSRKAFVMVSEEAAEHIKRSGSVLMPGVLSFDPEIQEGQEVLVVSGGSVIAVGKSRMSGEEARSRKKGVFVKVRRRRAPGRYQEMPGGQSAEDVLRANREEVERYEAEALSFVKSTIERLNLPVLVSFSGGKDSLATLLLVRKVVEPTVLFVDTGVEFPETKEYVKETAKALDLELVVVSAGDRFWRGLEVFGMSGRDYRWCCKVCKLGPVAKLIHERFPQGVLNFIGQRRYESLLRARTGRLWRNTWLPRQVSASPIQHWTALHVWLFLEKEGVKPNPLYELGFERIGCWLCPSSSLSEIQAGKELHPELWKELEERLRAQGFSEQELRHGLWRWRRLPKGQLMLAEKLGARRGRKPRPWPVRQVDWRRAANLAHALGIFPTRDVLARATLCLGCGVCLMHCEHRAVELLNGKANITSRCRGCGRCHLHCPIVKYL